MRGADTKQAVFFSTVSPEKRVPTNHPLRQIKEIADAALERLSPTFDVMYSAIGRPSIPPERLLKSSLLMALYTVRSERMFCEQLDYNILFRWFLDMNLDEPSFDPTTFTKNRDRLLDHDIARQFFFYIVLHAHKLGLLSDEHFTVDGTLIEAWASMKSFRKKGEKKDDLPPPDDPGNPTVDFHGEKRSNATHQSTTDPEALLAKKAKGKEAKLSYSTNVLMENRNGLVMNVHVKQATGTAEREAALAMLDEAIPGSRRLTVGGDKAYDTKDFVTDLRWRNATPHVAQNDRRAGGSMLDARTTRYPGYTISQRIRKRVEEVFGWMKTVGNFRRTRYKGQERTQVAAYFVAIAYNLVRMSRLMAEAT